VPIDVVPRIIIRSPRLQPGKIEFSDPKRLLQHYLPLPELAHHRLPGPSQSDQPDSRSYALDSRRRTIFADGGGLQHIALENPTKGVYSSARIYFASHDPLGATGA
jgi:hypothetical protein